MGESPIRRAELLPMWRHALAGGVSDAELLTRFAADRDEAAFELLVYRHGPMVLATCRRLLGNLHDAEDAFQAAFLALARKARSLTRREAVAAWLYRVACRVALRVRADRAKRLHLQKPQVERVEAADTTDPGLSELWQVLDEEIERLPARHRSAFVLCCLEGLTSAEAARELGCPPGTVSSRLTRARQRLRVRLTRRGLAPAVLAALGAIPQANAAVSLIQLTVAAAITFAPGRMTAGVEISRPAFLAKGVLRAMYMTKLKVVGLLLALVVLVSAGFLTRVMEAAPQAKDPTAKTERDPAKNPTPPPQRSVPGGPMGPRDETGRPPIISVVKPAKGGLDRIAKLQCSVESFQQAELVSGASGYVKVIAVDIGSKVKKGDLLAVIDAPALDLDERLALNRVEQAKILMRGSVAQLEGAKAEVGSATGIIILRDVESTAATASLKLREKQFERMRQGPLGNAGDLHAIEECGQQVQAAKAKVETAVAGVENAKAELAVKRARVLQSEAALETARANIDAATIALEKARLAVAATKLAAPFDGVVTHRHIVPGDYVFAGDSAARRPLLTVQRMDMVRVVVHMDQAHAFITEVGAPATVTMTVAGQPYMNFAGKISRIAVAVDPRSYTMRCEIDLPNPEMRLRPGTRGRVHILLQKGRPEGLHIPQSSFVKGKAMTGIYVVKDGKAYLTSVQIGYADEKNVEVSSGLREDDRVVTDPAKLNGTGIAVEIAKGSEDK